MAQRRGSVLLVMPLLVLTLFLVGCPKRPATPVASAPAHTGSALAPAPGAGPSTAPAAPGSSSGPTAMAPSTAAPATGAPAPGTPPRPSEFSENSNLKDVFFDFDRYDIRADDAKILDGNAAWLKSNASNLVLIEGHCDER